MSLKLVAVAAAVVVPVLLMVPVGTSAADEGLSTRVDVLRANVVGDVISIAGAATFVDVPRQVASDPAGDASVAGWVSAYDLTCRSGYDLTCSVPRR